MKIHQQPADFEQAAPFIEIEILATAVDAFENRFGANVLSADVLIVDNSDLAPLAGQLDDGMAVVGALPDEAAYWRVLGKSRSTVIK